MDVVVLSEIKKAEQKIIKTIEGKHAYGVRWDQSADIVERIGLARNLIQVDFNEIYPWAGMRRCVLNNDGTVNYYLHPDNSALQEDGTTPSVLDGTDGQVMVEIPRFFYRSLKYGPVYLWSVSPDYLEGYKIHPAFVRNNIIKDKIYIGAFEGYYNPVTGAMESRAGVQPSADSGGDSDYPDGTIVGCRGYANERNTIGTTSGWKQQDFLTTCAAQLLYLIEFASFDSQGQIGDGIVWLKSSTSGESDENHSQNTGHTVSLGNFSGESDQIDPIENDGTLQDGQTSNKAISYRGIENLWGNIWKWVDGINLNDYVPFVADHGYTNADPGRYEPPYYSTELTVLSNSGEYAKNIIWSPDVDFAYLASEGGGGSASYLHDCWWVGSGHRVARCGGGWYLGLQAGAFCWSLFHVASSASRFVGARLLFIP